MAKKKQDLSPEERLAAALVPEEEWPYALPDGWNWVRIGALNDYQSSSITPSTNPDDTFELYSVPSIVNDYPEITKGMDIGSTKQLVEKDDVLLCKINPRINRVWKVSAHTTHKCLASSEWIVVRARSFFASDYLMWFFRCPYFRERMLSNVSGVGGSLMRAKPRYVQTYPVALPPLSEQHCLVARIESLFAKLDAAKEKVQSVLDSHENRKAALLHDAFAGKLTAKWRREQGLSLNVWRIEKLENLCEKITCGKTPKNDIAPQGEIPYLKVYNIVNDEIDFQSKPQYIPRDVHETKLQSSKLKPNDVVMNIVGPPLRKIAVIPDTYPEWNMNQAIVRFRPKADLNYRFLYYALLNPETLDDVIQKTKGVVGQANISITQSRNLKIKLPSLPEQQEIVRILDRLLAREQRARQAAEETLAAIDRMKQAILARAFRGEL